MKAEVQIGEIDGLFFVHSRECKGGHWTLEGTAQTFRMAVSLAAIVAEAINASTIVLR
jgi:hypothetical protein